MSNLSHNLTKKLRKFDTYANALTVNSTASTVNRANQPLRNTLANHPFYYPTPSNLSYNWSFGSLVGLFFARDIVSCKLLNASSWFHLQLLQKQPRSLLLFTIGNALGLFLFLFLYSNVILFVGFKTFIGQFVGRLTIVFYTFRNAALTLLPIIQHYARFSKIDAWFFTLPVAQQNGYKNNFFAMLLITTLFFRPLDTMLALRPIKETTTDLVVRAFPCKVETDIRITSLSSEIDSNPGKTIIFNPEVTIEKTEPKIFISDSSQSNSKPRTNHPAWINSGDKRLRQFSTTEPRARYALRGAPDHFNEDSASWMSHYNPTPSILPAPVISAPVISVFLPEPSPLVNSSAAVIPAPVPNLESVSSQQAPTPRLFSIDAYKNLTQEEKDLSTRDQVYFRHLIEKNQQIANDKISTIKSELDAENLDLVTREKLAKNLSGYETVSKDLSRSLNHNTIFFNQLGLSAPAYNSNWNYPEHYNSLTYGPQADYFSKGTENASNLPRGTFEEHYQNESSSSSCTRSEDDEKTNFLQNPPAAHSRNQETSTDAPADGRPY